MRDDPLIPVKMNLLVEAIKKKKELHSLADNYVRDQLSHYLQNNLLAANSLRLRFNPKSALYKQTVKEIRAQLRRIYGLFRIEEKVGGKQETIALFLKNINDDSLLEKVLGFHSSTKERLCYYLELYQKIFHITKKPEVILDLGCGINPFSLPYMNLRKLHYYAYDLSEEEIASLNLFFQQWSQKKKKFLGQAAIFNILDIHELTLMPKADLAFLFKIADVLDQGKNHLMTEKVIKAIPAKYLVVSFATRTMSGKKMTAPRRKWMEWLCSRLGYKYHILGFENEIYYVIEK